MTEIRFFLLYKITKNYYNWALGRWGPWAVAPPALPQGRACLALVNDVVIPLISSTKSSCNSWDLLSCLYAKLSNQHIIHLKDKLSILTRGSSSVTDFLVSIKHIANEITILDAPPSDADLLLYNTCGLGPTYKELIIALRSRDSVVPVEDLFDKIIDHKPFSFIVKSRTHIRSHPHQILQKTHGHLFAHLNLVFHFLPLAYSLILFLSTNNPNQILLPPTLLFVNTVTNAVMMLKNVSSCFLTSTHIASPPIM